MLRIINKFSKYFIGGNSFRFFKYSNRLITPTRVENEIRALAGPDKVALFYSRPG